LAFDPIAGQEELAAKVVEVLLHPPLSEPLPDWRVALPAVCGGVRLPTLPRASTSATAEWEGQLKEARSGRGVVVDPRGADPDILETSSENGYAAL
jgi:hypothetical protein